MVIIRRQFWREIRANLLQDRMVVGPNGALGPRLAFLQPCQNPAITEEFARIFSRVRHTQFYQPRRFIFLYFAVLVDPELFYTA
jgi:hypothetical protein